MSAAAPALSNPGKRLDQAMTKMLADLARSAGRREVWRLQNLSDHHARHAFELAEKLPPKSAPDGSNQRVYKGPTRQQLLIMESSSQTIDELADRIKMFTVDGIDTTRMGLEPSAVDPQRLAAMVAQQVSEQVTAILSDPKRLAAFQQIAQPAPQRPTTPAYVDNRKGNGPMQRQRREIAMVKEQCKVLGIPLEDIKYNTSGAINRPWFKEHEARWAAYMATQKATAADLTPQ